MFHIEAIPAGGVGRTQPLRIKATQLILRTEDGTPFGVVTDLGPERSYRLVKVGDPDFAKVLKEMGLPPVTCDTFHAPRPAAGSRLLVP